MRDFYVIKELYEHKACFVSQDSKLDREFLAKLLEILESNNHGAILVMKNCYLDEPDHIFRSRFGYDIDAIRPNQV